MSDFNLQNKKIFFNAENTDDDGDMLIMPDDGYDAIKKLTVYTQFKHSSGGAHYGTHPFVNTANIQIIELDRLYDFIKLTTNHSVDSEYTESIAEWYLVGIYDDVTVLEYMFPYDYNISISDCDYFLTFANSSGHVFDTDYLAHFVHLSAETTERYNLDPHRIYFIGCTGLVNKNGTYIDITYDLSDYTDMQQAFNFSGWEAAWVDSHFRTPIITSADNERILESDLVPETDNYLLLKFDPQKPRSYPSFPTYFVTPGENSGVSDYTYVYNATLHNNTGIINKTIVESDESFAFEFTYGFLTQQNAYAVCAPGAYKIAIDCDGYIVWSQDLTEENHYTFRTPSTYELALNPLTYDYNLSDLRNGTMYIFWKVDDFSNPDDVKVCLGNWNIKDQNTHGTFNLTDTGIYSVQAVPPDARLDGFTNVRSPLAEPRIYNPQNLSLRELIESN